MIITRTPYRISFFGGGTDFKPWFSEHGGDILSTTINHYTYLSCRYLPPFNADYRNRIAWRILEQTDSVEDIQHNAVREALRHYDVWQGVEISVQGDLISRSGLGSSSVFCAGLIKSLFSLKGMMLSDYALAMETIRLEREILKESGGIQDQIAVVYGGFNRIHIHHNGSFSVDPVLLDANKREALNSRLMLFFTGISRNSYQIESAKIQDIGKRQEQLGAMQQMVGEALDILAAPLTEFDAFGHLLHRTWEMKKQLSDSVSSGLIDEIYEAAIANGALGGKILGAGGGGFILFYVPPEHQNDVRRALCRLIHVPFKFDDQGCQTVFYAPKEYPASVYANRDYIHLKQREQA